MIYPSLITANWKQQDSLSQPRQTVRQRKPLLLRQVLFLHIKNDVFVVNEGFLLCSQSVFSMLGPAYPLGLSDIYSFPVVIQRRLMLFSAPLTAASVKIVGSQPILNRTFALTCQTTGTVESVAWMYNWSLLYSDNRRMLSVDNTTLTFNPLVMSDNGNYSCMASNAISSATSKSLLLDILCEYLKRHKF